MIMCIILCFLHGVYCLSTSSAICDDADNTETLFLNSTSNAIITGGIDSVVCTSSTFGHCSVILYWLPTGGTDLTWSSFPSGTPVNGNARVLCSIRGYLNAASSSTMAHTCPYEPTTLSGNGDIKAAVFLDPTLKLYFCATIKNGANRVDLYSVNDIKPSDLTTSGYLPVSAGYSNALSVNITDSIVVPVKAGPYPLSVSIYEANPIDVNILSSIVLDTNVKNPILTKIIASNITLNANVGNIVDVNVLGVDTGVTIGIHDPINVKIIGSNVTVRATLGQDYVNVDLVQIEHVAPSQVTHPGNGSIPITSVFGNAVVVTIDGSLRPISIYNGMFPDAVDIKPKKDQPNPSLGPPPDADPICGHDQFFASCTLITSPSANHLGTTVFGSYQVPIMYYSYNRISLDGFCRSGLPLLIFVNLVGQGPYGGNIITEFCSEITSAGGSIEFTAGPVEYQYPGSNLLNINIYVDPAYGGSGTLSASDYLSLNLIVENSTSATTLFNSTVTVPSIINVNVQEINSSLTSGGGLKTTLVSDLATSARTVFTQSPGSTYPCTNNGCQILDTNLNTILGNAQIWNSHGLLVQGTNGGTNLPVTVSGDIGTTLKDIAAGIVNKIPTNTAITASVPLMIANISASISINASATIPVSIQSGSYTTSYAGGPPQLWQYPFDVNHPPTLEDLKEIKYIENPKKEDEIEYNNYLKKWWDYLLNKKDKILN